MNGNNFTIQFCKNLVFYEAVVEGSLAKCSCSNGKNECKGENKKRYEQEQVMGTILDDLKNYSLVQYCSGVGMPCCQNCNTNAGCTVTRYRYNGQVVIADFYGYNLDDMNFY